MSLVTFLRNDIVQPYLKRVGFGHVFNFTSYVVDNKFILAFIERWILETHTFHLPTGECIVTLEDVHMLLGLHINGNAINGPTNINNQISYELYNTPFVK